MERPVCKEAQQKIEKKACGLPGDFFTFSGSS